MMSTLDAVGTPVQEELIMLMVGLIEQYDQKKKGANQGSSYLQVMETGRQWMKNSLPIPFREMSGFSSVEKTYFLRQVLTYLITHYELNEYKKEIMDSCMVLYEQWASRYRN